MEEDEKLNYSKRPEKDEMNVYEKKERKQELKDAGIESQEAAFVRRYEKDAEKEMEKEEPDI